MARLSAYSRASVYLTLFALLLITISTWMRWYIVRVGSFAAGEFWLNYYNPIESGDIRTYYFNEALGSVMGGVKLLIVLWFAVALFFIANIISRESTANREFVTGGALAAVGVMLLGYFASSFPSACGSSYVSGFLSSVTVDTRVYIGGPGGGFVTTAIAFCTQVIAIALRFKAVFDSSDDKTPLDPYEARVGRPEEPSSERGGVDGLEPG